MLDPTDFVLLEQKMCCLPCNLNILNSLIPTFLLRRVLESIMQTVVIE